METSGSQSCVMTSTSRHLNGIFPRKTPAMRREHYQSRRDDNDDVQQWQQLAHLHQHIYFTKTRCAHTVQLVSLVVLYQPDPSITYALISMNGVRRCFDKNNLVASSLSLFSVHFLQPEGKLRRAGATQKKKPSATLRPRQAQASRRLEKTLIYRA